MLPETSADLDAFEHPRSPLASTTPRTHRHDLTLFIIPPFNVLIRFSWIWFQVIQIRRCWRLTDMSTRFNDGSHYENHQRAAELQDGAAHAHRVAEQQGQQEHLTGHELSRQASEHHASHDHQATPTVGHGIAAFGHAEIAALAHELWQAR